MASRCHIPPILCYTLSQITNPTPSLKRDILYERSRLCISVSDHAWHIVKVAFIKSEVETRSRSMTNSAVRKSIEANGNSALINYARDYQRGIYHMSRYLRSQVFYRHDTPVCKVTTDYLTRSKLCDGYSLTSGHSAAIRIE